MVDAYLMAGTLTDDTTGVFLCVVSCSPLTSQIGLGFHMVRNRKMLWKMEEGLITAVFTRYLISLFNRIDLSVEIYMSINEERYRRLYVAAIDDKNQLGRICVMKREANCLLGHQRLHLY